MLIALHKPYGVLSQFTPEAGSAWRTLADFGLPRGVYSLGRGHNADAMTMLLAGGGVKRGAIVGSTDELGSTAVDCVHPIRDLHVTLLHLLGLDDNKLTYFHGGRYKQLSQFGGQVITELLA